MSEISEKWPHLNLEVHDEKGKLPHQHTWTASPTILACNLKGLGLTALDFLVVHYVAGRRGYQCSWELSLLRRDLALDKTSLNRSLARLTKVRPCFDHPEKCACDFSYLKLGHKTGERGEQVTTFDFTGLCVFLGKYAQLGAIKPGSWKIPVTANPKRRAAGKKGAAAAQAKLDSRRDDQGNVLAFERKATS